MMNINQFVSEWNGKHVEADGSQPNSDTYDQCVDLVKEWEKENGWNPITHGNAIDYAKGESGYTWVPNSTTDSSNYPTPGDLVVFALGVYGHVGICVSANFHAVSVFQQNAPEAGYTRIVDGKTVFYPGSPCNIATYNYIKPVCVGWLHHN